VLRKNSDVVTNVTFWGLDDRSSWLNNYPVRGRKNFPLLFDNYRCPKQVLFKLVGDAKEGK
ncbi:MAG: endo-1,4-beta-xylanase, partial [Salinivirgaceae bacterium]|nr:endo-1,4-beta-xylanase [Salinivirgaceae bacterium]